jgi:hypothetical protein
MVYALPACTVCHLLVNHIATDRPLPCAAASRKVDRRDAEKADRWNSISADEGSDRSHEMSGCDELLLNHVLEHRWIRIWCAPDGHRPFVGPNRTTGLAAGDADFPTTWQPNQHQLRERHGVDPCASR